MSSLLFTAQTEFNRDDMKQDILTSLNDICLEKKVSEEEAKNFKYLVSLILHPLPENSLVRHDSFTHNDKDYFLLSFPVNDPSENPWDVKNIYLSNVLRRASLELNMTMRFQDQGTFLGLTLRFTLPTQGKSSTASVASLK